MTYGTMVKGLALQVEFIQRLERCRLVGAGVQTGFNFHGADISGSVR